MSRVKEFHIGLGNIFSCSINWPLEEVMHKKENI